MPVMHVVPDLLHDFLSVEIVNLTNPKLNPPPATVLDGF